MSFFNPQPWLRICLQAACIVLGTHGGGRSVRGVGVFCAWPRTYPAAPLRPGDWGQHLSCNVVECGAWICWRSKIYLSWSEHESAEVNVLLGNAQGSPSIDNPRHLKGDKPWPSSRTEARERLRPPVVVVHRIWASHLCGMRVWVKCDTDSSRVQQRNNLLDVDVIKREDL